MKTIRLLYPDHLSGGRDEYYFGANVMTQILPQNDKQPLIHVDIVPPMGDKPEITDGIYAKEEVLHGITDAMNKIEKEDPDKIITIGGNCMVSQAPFDYLHGKYKNTGIIWIDAHPDVSTPKDGYPNVHAMVLGSLMGYGDQALNSLMKNPYFKPKEFFYIGLQELHDYQQKFLDDMGVDYKIQTESFVTDKEIQNFAEQFDHILVHFDIDVLDEKEFHSTFFANPKLVGDGAGGGKMTLEKLREVFQCIQQYSDIVGFTIAEYLPFDEYRLHNILSDIRLFTE